MNDIDRVAHLLVRHLSFERSRETDAELGLEAGLDQFISAENIPARPRLENAAEDRLKEPELFLNGLGGKADFPADMALTGGNAPRDQRELDAVGVVEGEPIAIGLGKVLAGRARGPEILDRFGQIDRHGRSEITRG